jgi:hypothetical protein
MSILNLTQHLATADQIEVGVVEPTSKEEVKSLLTITALPTMAELNARAEALAALAAREGAEAVMIGGAPYLMAPLERALKGKGIKVLYAFSQRKSIDVHKDGVVTKTAIFVHAGWIEV